jgi:hypothetical protein
MTTIVFVCCLVGGLWVGGWLVGCRCGFVGVCVVDLSACVCVLCIGVYMCVRMCV